MYFCHSVASLTIIPSSVVQHNLHFNLILEIELMVSYWLAITSIHVFGVQIEAIHRLISKVNN
jgi:hypothetical protein